MSSILDKLINLAIEEDIGKGDVTTSAIVDRGLEGVGRIEAKEDIIIAGLKVAEKVFAKVDKKIVFEPACEDGDGLEAGALIATASGELGSLLKAERTALNFLQHLSGVATFTNLFVKMVHGTKTKILDTRKTTPGYRELEKEAVAFGEGENHRMGLFDRYLIKGNHIDITGSIGEAVRRVKEKRAKGLLIEVEARDIAEVEDAAQAGVDIIMLDNFTPKAAKEAVALVKGRAKVEISGNINIDNIREYAKSGAAYISIGAITHSAPAADIHMIIQQ